MTYTGTAAALPAARSRLSSQWRWPAVSRADAIAYGLILLAAIIVRFPDLGSPAIDFDEQFYLLVGDRMIHGAIPYVDIWDRKPIGLFLIYAFVRLFGGQGFLEYQLLALASAAGTGLILYRISTRIAAPAGAAAAAILYLLNLRLFGSAAGQSETFYNLLSAAVALLAVQTFERDDLNGAWRRAAAAMALCGLMLQIKYTVFPQCAAFGLVFLWRLHQLGVRPARLIGGAALFAAIGLAPTALATAVYAALGHLDAFVQANFVSIFDRGRLSGSLKDYFETYILFGSGPLFLTAIAATVLGRGQPPLATATRRIVLAWLLATLAGFIMIGNIYIHYFAPVLLPLLVLCAPMFGRTRAGVVLAAALGLFAASAGGMGHAFASTREQRQAIGHITALVRPYVRPDACLYVYDGPSSLYLTSKSCLPGRFTYPDHLNNAMEEHALGIDTRAEVARILATRPGAIVFAAKPVVPAWNRGTEQLVRAAIARDYRRAGGAFLYPRYLNVYVRRGSIPAARPDLRN